MIYEVKKGSGSGNGRTHGVFHDSVRIGEFRRREYGWRDRHGSREGSSGKGGK